MAREQGVLATVAARLRGAGCVHLLPGVELGDLEAVGEIANEDAGWWSMSIRIGRPSYAGTAGSPAA